MCGTSRANTARGITPMTSPPAAMARSASSPIMPDLRAAVHDADVARHQPVGQCDHTVAVGRGARGGAQEDRDAHGLI